MKLEKLSQAFSNLYNACTKSINKRYDREGSLLKIRVKRNRISSEEYLKNAILYIHLNPVKHGYTDTIEKYEYSSLAVFYQTKEQNLREER